MGICVLCGHDVDEDNLFCGKCRRKHCKIIEDSIESGMDYKEAHDCANKRMNVPESGLDGWVV